MENVVLKVRESEAGREYQLPSGIWVPSVTTVLGYFYKEHLIAWRNKVGAEKAETITRLAAERGTRLHNLCEIYIRKEPIAYKKLRPTDLDLFRTIRPYLDEITEVEFIEASLYSEKYKIAGRTDVIGKYNNKKSIIDFKTTTWDKREEWITKYFEQETIYSIMYEEMYGEKIEQIVTIVVGNESSQMFIKNRNDYELSAIQKIENYHAKNSTNFGNVTVTSNDIC